MPTETGWGGSVSKRLFVVGCSRSGTTLLQVSIASHSRIQSFPETFFFYHAAGKWRRRLPWLEVASGNERPALEHVLREVGRLDLKSDIPERIWWFRKAAGVYVGWLDRITLEAGNDVWVEKTPLHVLRLPLIERYVPEAHVIHILRDGRDVVASICDRAEKFPEQFPGQRKLSYGIELWNTCLEASMRCLGQPGHTFTLYENLTTEPGEEVRRLCSEIGIAYEPSMIEDKGSDANDIVPTRRPWIQRAKEPPAPRPSKFERIFDEQEKQEITRRLDLSTYERARQRIAEGARVK